MSPDPRTVPDLPRASHSWTSPATASHSWTFADSEPHPSAAAAARRTEPAAERWDTRRAA
jgi:hypothetical protein